MTIWLAAAVAPAAIMLSGGAQVAVDHLSSTDLFALAGRARAAGRIDDAVRIYDALARDPDDQVRAEARFRKGMMLAAVRRYREAATAFRALLDEKPGAARARLELARVLAAMGDEDAAKRELRQAEAGGLPPDVAVTVENFARALHSSQKFGGSIELALVPDSNVNRATSQRTLDTIIAPLTLSDDAREQSGLGAKVSGQGFARLAIGDDLFLLPRGSVLANLYRHDEFDDVSAAALLGLEWRRGGDRLTPSIGETIRWYGAHPYARTQTLTVDWLHPSGTQAQWTVSASANRARYQRNALQDGAIYTLSVDYDQAISARAGLSASLAAERQTAADRGYSTWSASETILGWHEFGHVTAFASVGLRRLEGDAALFLFPRRRREWLVQASAGATFRQFAVHGFAPVVRLNYERNVSTVGIYDYGRVSADIGITRSF